MQLPISTNQLSRRILEFETNMNEHTQASQKGDGEPHYANNIEHIGVSRPNSQGLDCVVSQNSCLSSLKQKQHKNSPFENTIVIWEGDVVQILMDQLGRCDLNYPQLIRTDLHQ